MATPGQILLIGGGALLAAWGLSRRKKKADTAVAPESCNPAPYTFNRGQVVERIDNYLDQGRREPGGIASDVATDLFSPHPTGPAVAFPPLVNPEAGLPLQGVDCVFNLTGQTVLERMTERGMDPGEDPIPQGPLIFQKGGAGDPGYPWEAPLIHKENMPTPGMFFIVGQKTGVGDNAFGINNGTVLVNNALGSAMAMAGNLKLEWIQAPPQGAGQDHPYFNNNAKRLRSQMARLIRYSPWNDQLYGQTDPDKAGSALAITPCGRGLNWLPRHADNIGRLAQGKAPLRTTTIQGNKLPAPNTGAHQMQLWIPAVNLAMLGPNVPDASLSVTTDGQNWSTGDSTLIPPPQVWGRGIDSVIAGAAQWGCPGVS